jgi:List-Bact-rpt repeat protein
MGVLGAALGVGGAAQAASGPQPPGHTLTVTETGTGTGSVRSVDGAISCPPACNHFYTSTAPVTLTATPGADGSTFVGWGGSCTGTAPTCTVDMTSDRAATATFNSPASGPPPAAPTCTLRVPATHVLLKAPKGHPAQTKKVGLVVVVFSCDEAVSAKLVVKVTERVPGSHHHKGHKTSFTLTKTLSLPAGQAHALTVKLWRGALRGLAKRYQEIYKVTLTGRNANGADRIVRSGALHGTG